MRVSDARRSARHEVADHAAMLARAAEETASQHERDREGAADARRMAVAYRAVASQLDPETYPPPPRRLRAVPGTVELVTPDGQAIMDIIGERENA